MGEEVINENESKIEKNTKEKNVKESKKDDKPKIFLYAHPLVKVFSFFGAVIALVAVILFIAATVVIGSEGLYAPDPVDSALDSHFETIAAMNVRMVIALLEGGNKETADEFLGERNIACLELTSDNYVYRYIYLRSGYTKNNLPDQYVYSGIEDTVTWKIYLIPEFNTNYDAYQRDFTYITYGYQFRYWVLAGILISGVVCILFSTLYISGIGVSYRTGEAKENIFTKIPFDLVTFVYLFGLCLGFPMLNEFADIEQRLCVFAYMIIISAMWIINFIHRIKLQNVFRNTICYRLIRLLWLFIKNIPVIWLALLITAIISIGEFFISICFGAGTESFPVFLLLLFIFFMEKCIVCPIIFYILIMTSSLFKAGNELAKGNTDYKVKLTHLFGSYKKHGDNLNNLSLAVNRAVDEKMKSERMKTELITNVSHDLKTPLTSVINYSDLINTEAAKYVPNEDATESMERISEYSEVLNRQSNKLKRLLDDLVDISKATTGNMEVILEKIEVGTMLSQAAAEYEDRFEEKHLETVENIPEGRLYVKADSRKLWRVVDNLLQNIYKYSCPGTRVFLEAKETDKKVFLTFKNTSRDIITISPDELTERFTRNDESRHMEGNGLGLAIAKTMTEVQGGDFKLEIDGDLFKVTVGFEKIEEVKEENENETAAEIESVTEAEEEPNI